MRSCTKCSVTIYISLVIINFSTLTKYANKTSRTNEISAFNIIWWLLMAEMKKGKNYQFNFKRDIKWMQYALAIVLHCKRGLQQLTSKKNHPQYINRHDKDSTSHEIPKDTKFFQSWKMCKIHINRVLIWLQYIYTCILSKLKIHWGSNKVL